MNKSMKVVSDTVCYLGMTVAGISAIVCGYTIFDHGVTGFYNDVITPAIKAVNKAIGGNK